MKAYEILVEYEWSFNGGSNSGGMDAGLIGGAANLAGRVLGGAKGKGGSTTVAGANKPTPQGKNQYKPVSGNQSTAATKPSMKEKFRNYKETNKAKLAAMESKWQKSYGGTMTKIFTVMGMVIPTTQLYADLEGIQEAYDAGEITQDDLIELREERFGVYQFQLLVPSIARAAIKIIKIISFANWVKRIGTVISAPVTFGVSVAAGLASELFISWLQQWLGTKEGQEWLADHLMSGVVRTFGKGGESVWSALTDYYKTSGAADAAGKSLKAGQQPQQAPRQPTA